MFCESRGWSVSDFDKQMSPDEWAVWNAYYSLYPYPQDRADIRSIRLSQAVHQSAYWPRKNHRVEDDLFPWSIIRSPDEQKKYERRKAEATKINERIKLNIVQRVANRGKTNK